MLCFCQAEQVIPELQLTTKCPLDVSDLISRPAPGGGGGKDLHTRNTVDAGVLTISPGRDCDISVNPEMYLHNGATHYKCE